ncbi:MAG: efflux RND transporter periplasmic adaptor subunit [Lachnospiraceae bacterium]|nr:efflux RND transporter periplasmic adaptor subunit [Lachnospiraceae bacterium]
MKNIKGIVACAMASSLVLLSAGCEKTDIHEIDPIVSETYQKTIPETVEVQKGDMQPVIRLKLNQNSLKYYNYSVDIEDLEFSELKVSSGDYVRAGQVLCVLKSEKIEKALREASEALETDKLLLEHTKKLRAIDVDPDKPDDENNKKIAEMYDRTIANLEDDIRLQTIRVAESQRDLDSCIIKARDDGVITYVSDAIKNGVVVLKADLFTQACGDVGFYTEYKEDDYDFEVGQVFEAASATMQFDVKITRIDENESGSITIHFMPVSDDVLYVSNDKFEVIIPKEKITNVVYLEERLLHTATNGKQFVYVLDEDGFKNPVYVEVDMVVEGMAIIKSGLEGGEEVTVK